MTGFRKFLKYFLYINLSMISVGFSHEPGWLQGTLNGKTGLIPENYVEHLKPYH